MKRVQGTGRVSLPLLVALLAAAAGCDIFLLQTEGELRDVGIDAEDRTEDAVAPEDGTVETFDGGCRNDDECSDDNLCNGRERCVEGSCRPPDHPADCNDGVGCTRDYCDPISNACTHIAQNVWCPGGHSCDAEWGCVQPASCVFDSDCSDHFECTIDQCVADGTRCAHDPWDNDDDGVGDRNCPGGGLGGGGDCDDSDPTVAGGFPETCRDLKDNDCDGLTDYEEDVCGPPFGNDTCETALPLFPGMGVVVPGNTSTHTNTRRSEMCGGDGPDAFYVLELTERRSLLLRVSSAVIDPVVCVIAGGCGGAEIGCNDDRTQSYTDGSRLEFRSLPAGTYFIVADGAYPADGGPYTLEYTEGPPQGPAECGTAVEASEGGTYIGTLPPAPGIDPLGYDYGTCGDVMSMAGEEERFRLDLPASTSVWATSAGTPFTSHLYARAEECRPTAPPGSSELACASGLAGAGAVIEFTTPSDGSWVTITLDADRASTTGTYRVEIRPASP